MAKIEESPNASFLGFNVTMTKPDPHYEAGTSEDAVIFIDTPEGFTGNIRIRVNDALIYDANPDKEEDVNYTQLDGFHIINKH